MPPSSRRYVALIRAINVGGHSIIRMAALSKLFESLGFEDVITYIQTGNVVFSSTNSDAKRMAAQIEEALEAETGHSTTVFVLKPAELRRTAANNPFDPERRDAEWRCHLLFLAERPTTRAVAGLMEVEGDDYRFHVKGKVLYYAYPRRVEGKVRRTVNFEKILGTTGTARTWKVVDRLVELST
jgi:uncharacterized protein (DUF1697 family)